ncbi:hypothetical protein HDU76_008921 [Blyttiomyces sp. JEL0837]|nr:hypothetical protein HDU76_008921 [Blyttiomyces sp. JEL0837]
MLKDLEKITLPTSSPSTSSTAAVTPTTATTVRSNSAHSPATAIPSSGNGRGGGSPTGSNPTSMSRSRSAGGQHGNDGWGRNSPNQQQQTGPPVPSIPSNWQNSHSPTSTSSPNSLARTPDIAKTASLGYGLTGSSLAVASIDALLKDLEATAGAPPSSGTIPLSSSERPGSAGGMAMAPTTSSSSSSFSPFRKKSVSNQGAIAMARNGSNGSTTSANGGSPSNTAGGAVSMSISPSQRSRDGGLLRVPGTAGTTSSNTNGTGSNGSTPPGTPNSTGGATGSLGLEVVRKERERREAERLAREALEKERAAKEAELKRQAEIAEAKRLEEERKREALEEAKAREKAKRDRERRELEREDAERRARQIEKRISVAVGLSPGALFGGLGWGNSSMGGNLLSPNGRPESPLRDSIDVEPPVDESVIVPDYVRGLITTLRSDPTLTPTPDDFSSTEVIEARGLIAKEGRSRDAYCKIEFGHFPDDMAGGQGGSTRGSAMLNPAGLAPPEVYMTDVVIGNTSPVWNQHLELKATNLTDKIILTVWDRRKDDFLGQVRLTIGDLITQAAKEGFVSRFYRLMPRDGAAGRRDKYVGGEVLLEMSIDTTREATPQDIAKDPVAYLETQLLACKINFKALYKTLLRSCVVLDMIAGVLNDRQNGANGGQPAEDLLSNESRTLLKLWARKWVVGEAFQVIAYLELLFNKYKSYEVPVWALLHAYETLYASMKANSLWLSVYEKPALVELLEEMNSYYTTQVTKYKEFFPKNKPDEALESTILMLRMIFKNPIYRESHPHLPQSFRGEIRSIMSDACKARYQKLQELTSPFDESDVEAVIEGAAKLAEMLTEELIADSKYFRKPFEMELDIVMMTGLMYIESFTASMEQLADVIGGDEAVRVASKGVFTLYKKLKAMNQRYLKLLPSLSKNPAYKKFDVERWFLPFVSKWLDHLASKTVEWVTNAVKADAFNPTVGTLQRDAEGQTPHSSSVTDLFHAVYSELEFIIDMGWENQVQNAGFFQKFSKTVNRAIEQYCDAIGVGEPSSQQSIGSALSTFLQSRQANATTAGPADITSESCVKLCNIEYALTRLDDMYRIMNVAVLTLLTRTMKDYRATLHPPKKLTSPTSPDPKHDSDEPVKGAFKLQLSYAENIKPVTKAGLANAYLVLRVPENTVVPPPDPDDPVASLNAATSTKMAAGATAQQQPLILTGSTCEVARTRAIADTLNPNWDETFTTLLPPIQHLEVAVYSKNLLTADELCGTGVIDLSGRLSRLKRKLQDHLTHDVFIDLEPQGRVLIRMTLEGEEEDVDFWFRRSKERLGRTRDDFLRALCSKISPYIREVLSKSIKEHEAAPLPSKSFFSSLTAAVQYSNQTQSGIAIDQRVTSAEADVLLEPLADYLNRNLMTLCRLLSVTMAQEVIKRTWDDTLSLIDYVLVPALYGQIERDRRVLNKRQVSMAEWSLRILRDFFHADGEEMGLPLKTLESRKYVDLTTLMTQYHVEIARLRRDYELSLLQGREKELLLRLLRLRFEKQEDMTAADREEGKKWFEAQLVKRREKK